jgi:repressor LexA
MMPEPLTELERNILDYVVEYLRANTYQPSIREIGRRFGIKSTKTVSEYLQSLADKGWIERDPSRSRGVRLLDVDLRPDIISVPVYGGLAEDGPPVDRRRQVDVLELDRKLAGAAGRFFVSMPGEGMRDAGIRSADLLLVEPVQFDELTDGDTVVARRGGAVLVKRLYRHGAELLLESANPDFPPFRVPRGEIEVVGRVLAVVRRLAPQAVAAPAGVATRSAGDIPL